MEFAQNHSTFSCLLLKTVVIDKYFAVIFFFFLFKIHICSEKLYKTGLFSKLGWVAFWILSIHIAKFLFSAPGYGYIILEDL